VLYATLPFLSPSLVFAAALLGSDRLGKAGEQDLRKLAVTNIHQADADFAYQGEYRGSMCDPSCGVRRRAGLQVVARGGGKFDAVLYRGGLPGAGGDLRTRTKLTGASASGVLTLNAENLTVTCDGRAAHVRDALGRSVGCLANVQRVSPSLGAAPPRGAIILFDGTSTAELDDARISNEGLLEVGAVTKREVGDFRLHLEFRLPYMPHAVGQGRGNSGVYIQRRYEVQILDSFGLDGTNNECGALYRQQPPALNMCLPPLAWQTYDIWFTAARWDAEGNKIANARITLRHNGVPVHSCYKIATKTGAGRPEGPDELPILLQNHGNPVQFRNIWMVEGSRPGAVASCACPARLPCGWLHRLLGRLRCRE
jgi:hypothetical protein